MRTNAVAQMFFFFDDMGKRYYIYKFKNLESICIIDSHSTHSGVAMLRGTQVIE